MKYLFTHITINYFLEEETSNIIVQFANNTLHRFEYSLENTGLVYKDNPTSELKYSMPFIDISEMIHIGNDDISAKLYSEYMLLVIKKLDN